LKEVDPPEEITQPDDVLAARKGSGVSKKKHQKPLTRQQRLRKEKGIARAEAVVDQLENKVVKSKSSARVIKSRAVRVCIGPKSDSRLTTNSGRLGRPEWNWSEQEEGQEEEPAGHKSAGRR